MGSSRAGAGSAGSRKAPQGDSCPPEMAVTRGRDHSPVPGLQGGRGWQVQPWEPGPRSPSLCLLPTPESHLRPQAAQALCWGTLTPQGLPDCGDGWGPLCSGLGGVGPEKGRGLGWVRKAGPGGLGRVLLPRAAESSSRSPPSLPAQTPPEQWGPLGVGCTWEAAGVLEPLLRHPGLSPNRPSKAVGQRPGAPYLSPASDKGLLF